MLSQSQMLMGLLKSAPHLIFIPCCYNYAITASHVNDSSFCYVLCKVYNILNICIILAVRSQMETISLKVQALSSRL